MKLGKQDWHGVRAKAEEATRSCKARAAAELVRRAAAANPN